jgi:epoxyqueuosine reductase QueG
MKREVIIGVANDFIRNDSSNVITRDFALDPALVGVRMFDEPIVRFGDARDPLFHKLKEEGVIGPHFKEPTEWLAGADTVISIFLPIAQVVKDNNKLDKTWPSPGWLHARIEGQAMINRLNAPVQEAIRAAGYEVVAPFLDPRFRSREVPSDDPVNSPAFTSNWSERHVAFICGTGTFGLSKGLITEKGVAGRITSVVTNLHLPRDKRSYSDIYENCSMCGACVQTCPVGAISLETGKDHVKCSSFLAEVKIKYKPRYGCGKCQVKVPCESKACGQKA